MTEIMHTFAWAIINGDGFLLSDTDTGRTYIFGSEEQAEAVLHSFTDDISDMHVAVVAVIPVDTGEDANYGDDDDLFEIIEDDDVDPDKPWL